MQASAAHGRCAAKALRLGTSFAVVPAVLAPTSCARPALDHGAVWRARCSRRLHFPCVQSAAAAATTADDGQPSPHDPASKGAVARPRKLRGPFDNKYLWGLVWQQRSQLVIAVVCLVLCTTSNLAAPVLSGMLTETLMHNRPMEEYTQVPCSWCEQQTHGSNWAELCIELGRVLTGFCTVVMNTRQFL